MVDVGDEVEVNYYNIHPSFISNQVSQKLMERKKKKKHFWRKKRKIFAFPFQTIYIPFSFHGFPLSFLYFHLFSTFFCYYCLSSSSFFSFFSISSIFSTIFLRIFFKIIHLFDLRYITLIFMCTLAVRRRRPFGPSYNRATTHTPHRTTPHLLWAEHPHQQARIHTNCCMFVKVLSKYK